jgi:AbrB family looped-hinge helix DNA binding protein
MKMMTPTTVKMGKRGNVVLPAKLRKQLGLEDGTLLMVEARDGEIRLRPAILVERSGSQEDRDYAIYTLLNSRTREEWDANFAATLELGVERAAIDGRAPNHRETLPARAEWEAQIESRRASRLEALHSS